jgi:hypothetical protein
MKWKYVPLLLFFVAIIVIPFVVNCVRNNKEVDPEFQKRQIEKLREHTEMIERRRIEDGEYVLIDEGDSLYHISVRCKMLRRMPEVTFKFIVEREKSPCPKCVRKAKN